jgi:head-tail adaptor
MPGAGDLRAQVKFSKPDAVPDAYGNVATGWLDMFTVAANITPRLGGETVEAARLAGRQPVVIRVRHSTDTTQIKTDWRATTVEGPTPAGVVYNIRTAVDPFEGNVDHGKWIDMLAEAGVAA